MAFASLFTLPDYITAVLDDVALMTKAAAKKTAGVAGDDLAPNANRVTGVSAERELPIVSAGGERFFCQQAGFGVCGSAAFRLPAATHYAAFDGRRDLFVL